MRSDKIILWLGVVFSGRVCGIISAHTGTALLQWISWLFPTTFIWFALQGSPGAFWKGFLPNDTNPEGHCRDVPLVAVHCQQQISASLRCVPCGHWLLSSNIFNLQICSYWTVGNANVARDCSIKFICVWFVVSPHTLFFFFFFINQCRQLQID